MVAIVRLRDDASERVLDALQLLDVRDFGAVEQRVAVIEPGADDAASDGIRHSTVQHWSDVPQRSDVEIAGLTMLCACWSKVKLWSSVTPRIFSVCE